MILAAILLLIVFVGAPLLIIFLVKATRKNKYYQKEYASIIDVDKETAERRSKLQLTNNELHKLKEKYDRGIEAFEYLTHETNLLREDLEIAEFGVYEPYFDFETSAKFKEEIKAIRQEQKALIKEDKAVSGGDGWTVNGSHSDGRKMVNKQKKLMLRAFNGECDSFVSGVKWNNIRRMEERLTRSRTAINKMGETQQLSIAASYESLKLKELRLSHEYRLKKHEEKEIQRELRAQIREEERAQKEFEKARKEAEKEERMLQKAMDKVRKEMGLVTEEEKENYEKQLADLEVQLQEAEEKNQRAISMAELTRSGHVYVISNVGSFGEDIYKIGMTRRLEPHDRIYELGDASVPFRFDVHAMIYSDDAPELENKLHKAFEEKRLNYVNRRREYFNVTLEEIQEVVIENHGEIEFTLEYEAKEYRESKTILDELLKTDDEPPKASSKFPDSNELFG